MSVHTCHHPRCQTAVPPKMFACKGHWFSLPRPLRDAIWTAYVLGQEIRKDPSSEYMAASGAAIRFWIARERQA